MKSFDWSELKRVRLEEARLRRDLGQYYLGQANDLDPDNASNLVLIPLDLANSVVKALTGASYTDPVKAVRAVDARDRMREHLPKKR